jgi:hypothetical protein
LPPTFSHSGAYESRPFGLSPRRARELLDLRDITIRPIRTSRYAATFGGVTLLRAAVELEFGRASLGDGRGRRDGAPPGGQSPGRGRPRAGHYARRAVRERPPQLRRPSARFSPLQTDALAFGPSRHTQHDAFTVRLARPTRQASPNPPPCGGCRAGRVHATRTPVTQQSAPGTGTTRVPLHTTTTRVRRYLPPSDGGRATQQLAVYLTSARSATLTLHVRLKTPHALAAIRPPPCETPAARPEAQPQREPQTNSLLPPSTRPFAYNGTRTSVTSASTTVVRRTLGKDTATTALHTITLLADCNAVPAPGLTRRRLTGRPRHLPILLSHTSHLPGCVLPLRCARAFAQGVCRRVTIAPTTNSRCARRSGHCRPTPRDVFRRRAAADRAPSPWLRIRLPG